MRVWVLRAQVLGCVRFRACEVCLGFGLGLGFWVSAQGMDLKVALARVKWTKVGGQSMLPRLWFLKFTEREMG